MKKKENIIISVLLGVILIIVAVTVAVVISVSNNSEIVSNSDIEDTYNTSTTSTTTTERTTENTTQKVSLSASCDKILASGTYEGNTYELVATQEETYNDVVIKVGVIKNNEWLVPLTTDSPLLDGKYLIKQVGFSFVITKNLKDLTQDNSTYSFIGNGCFYCSATRIVYNAEIDKELDLDRGEEILYPHFYEDVCSDKFILEYYEDDSYQYISVLDTNTMEMNIILESTDYFGNRVLGPLADGFFAMGDIGSLKAFYDINGKKVLDVSEYEIQVADDTYGKSPYFENGQFKFVATNEAGTKYDMVIDKSGNVLSSVKQSESN